MCGISGIYSKNSAEKDILLYLEKMLQTIHYRGPDGQGTFIGPDKKLGLGHIILSIIDPGHAQQPMACHHSNNQIIFNGCIFNYKEIRALLIQEGHSFKTNSDTEVILKAYLHWGENCVNYFNGMWAFALYDAKKNSLFCSRDRLGIKPFYYYDDGQNFIFASEIKAILATKIISPIVCKPALEEYLTFQFTLGNKTLFEGIKKLEPGHNLIFSPDKGLKINQYWDVPQEQIHHKSEEVITEELKELISQSVNIHMTADVPVGAYLSGGLDSSAVTSLIRSHFPQAHLKVFTGAFQEGLAYDETGYAREVAKVNNAEHIVKYISASEFQQHLQKIIWHMDEPAAGPGVFPQYLISQEVSKHLRVVVGGQGGDEIFGGYARYLISALEQAIKKAILPSTNSNVASYSLGDLENNLSVLSSYVPMLRSYWSKGLFEENSARYFHLINRFKQSSNFLARELSFDQERIYEEFSSIYEKRFENSSFSQNMYFDLKTHLQSLLHVEDRVSMANSIESRVPLLDYRLVEYAFSIPDTLKIKDGKMKYIFTKAMSDYIPPKVLNRTDKKGFPVPLDIWAKNELKGFLHDTLLNNNSENLFQKKYVENLLNNDQGFSRDLWGVLSLQTWYSTFKPSF